MTTLKSLRDMIDSATDPYFNKWKPIKEKLLEEYLLDELLFLSDGWKWSYLLGSGSLLDPVICDKEGFDCSDLVDQMKVGYAWGDLISSRRINMMLGKGNEERLICLTGCEGCGLMRGRRVGEGWGLAEMPFYSLSFSNISIEV